MKSILHSEPKTRLVPYSPGLVLSILSLVVASLNPVAAQNTGVSYQGRVQISGTDFTGNGQFKFAIVTATNYNKTATATATISGGFVTIIDVTFAGNGYVIAPAVDISGGGGSGAVAHATLSGGTVSGVVVDNPGHNYSSPPTVTIGPPPPNVAYTSYWSIDGTSVNGSEPASAVMVPVSAGVFTILLGDTTLANMGAIPSQLFLHPDLRLRLWFSDGVHGFAVLDPAQPLTAAPYAFVAANVADLSGTYNGLVAFNNVNNQFAGNGAGLTALAAGNLSGTLPTAVIGDSSISAAKLASDAASLTKVTGGNMAVSGSYVGVGTTTPTAKLHIVGTSGTDGIRFPDGSLQTRAPVPLFSSGLGNSVATTNNFLSVTVPVTVQSTSQRVLITSHKAFGSTAASGAANLDLYVGFRLAGSAAAPSTVGGGILDNRVAANTRVIMGMSGVATGLAAGTYDVGLIGNSPYGTNWNWNEWSYTTAVVY